LYPQSGQLIVKGFIMESFIVEKGAENIAFIIITVTCNSVLMMPEKYCPIFRLSNFRRRRYATSCMLKRGFAP